MRREVGIAGRGVPQVEDSLVAGRLGLVAPETLVLVAPAAVAEEARRGDEGKYRTSRPQRDAYSSAHACDLADLIDVLGQPVEGRGGGCVCDDLLQLLLDLGERRLGLHWLLC